MENCLAAFLLTAYITNYSSDDVEPMMFGFVCIFAQQSYHNWTAPKFKQWHILVVFQVLVI